MVMEFDKEAQVSWWWSTIEIFLPDKPSSNCEFNWEACLKPHPCSNWNRATAKYVTFVFVKIFYLNFALMLDTNLKWGDDASPLGIGAWALHDDPFRLRRPDVCQLDGQIHLNTVRIGFRRTLQIGQLFWYAFWVMIPSQNRLALSCCIGRMLTTEVFTHHHWPVGGKATKLKIRSCPLFLVILTVSVIWISIEWNRNHWKMENSNGSAYFWIVWVATDEMRITERPSCIDRKKNMFVIVCEVRNTLATNQTTSTS